MAETAQSSHTPGPWRFEQSQGGAWFVYGETGDNQPIKPRIKVPKRGTKLMIANAEFIVRAVNSHADLLEALKPITQIMKLQRMFEPDELKRKAWDEPIAVAEAAILAAEGTK